MASRHFSSQPYGHCDTFFVESDHETAYFNERAKVREQSRIMAREHQRQMAKDLSRMTQDEYQDDILKHMEFMECETLPDVGSIDIQTEIQWFMRPYLLDFLIEAHGAFQLLPETHYLAINLLDRYCSKRVVYKRHYQLVGCAALLIAAKYGDRKDRVPTVRELKSMCCSLYEDEMFTQMEWHVLVTLDWKIGHPTLESFLKMSLVDEEYDPELEHMALYVSEIALFHKDFISVRPSVMARSCLTLARCILSRPVLPNQSDWSAHYDPQVLLLLSQKLQHPSQVLQKKYSYPQLSCASNTLQVFLEQQAQISQHFCPPTPPSDAGLGERKGPIDVYNGPHTPQKNHHLRTSTYGYMTPPITPESDMLATNHYNKYPHAVPQMCPTTPTPPSSTENHQYTNPPQYGSAPYRMTDVRYLI